MGKPDSTEVTASAVMSLIEKLEDESSQFYRKIAEKYTKSKETFLAFAKEGEKNKTMVIRTYQETITDALEACFSFKGLNLASYQFETTLPKNAKYADVLKTSLKLEESANRFYIDVAECSGSLLATIPRSFRKVAEIRSKRQLKLKSLLNDLK